MATTSLFPLRVNKGKSVAQTISERTDYVENPKKTNDGKLVSGYKCDPLSADVEFLLSKKEYISITGRDQGMKDVLAYHIRQSFKPGEITPEMAHKVGYELAMRFTKGRHQFIIATHVDKKHIHSHIIFSSVTVDCRRKFRNFWDSSRALRRLNDQICIEYGMSIVEKPKPSRGKYDKWLGDKKPETGRDILRQQIDSVLESKPANMNDFITGMKTAGYESKEGKHLAFRARGQKRFIRLYSMGDDYSEIGICERIEGKRIVSKKTSRADGKKSAPETASVSLLIDIENNIKAKNSPGYERWAKVFNLKQAAQTLIYLQENGLTEYGNLEKKEDKAKADFNELSEQIKEAQAKLHEIAELEKQIGAYAKTRETYKKYIDGGRSEQFYTEHESAIRTHMAAKKAFNELGIAKLPSIQSLKSEYAARVADKKKLYQSYREAREKMIELTTVKQNADRLLRYNDVEKGDGKDRGGR